jgi:hypothetical protein
MMLIGDEPQSYPSYRDIASGYDFRKRDKVGILSEPACTELTVILRHGCPLYSSRADMISGGINVG